MAKQVAKSAKSLTANPPFDPPQWAALDREMRSVSSLVANPLNSRTHPQEQVDALRASIKEFGIAKATILVDERDMLIAGHGMTIAAGLEGIEEVPVCIARGWSHEKKLAFMEADNQLALLSGWNLELRMSNLTQLRTMDFPLQALGWTAPTLDAYLGAGRLKEDPERVPDPPAKPMVRRGDVWVLGNHRLMCGDATSKSDVAACLDGAKPHLMVTDPPYGVEYDPLWREATVNRFGDGRAVARGAVSNDDRVDWTEAWKLFPGDAVYVWHGALHSAQVAFTVMNAGFDMRAQIIWAKQNFALSRGDYHWMHEPCWYAVRKGRRSHWAGDRKQTTLWEIKSINPVGGGGKGEDLKVGHGTQKPIECMRRPIVNNSKPGDSVYDPFVGSGTTIMAAEVTGRRCFAMELEPAYVEVCIRRWEAATKLQAVLSGTTRTFAAVLAELAKKRKPNEARHPGKPVSRKRPVAAEPDSGGGRTSATRGPRSGIAC